jgi:hypothetical protein
MKAEDFPFHLKVLGWLDIIGSGLFLAGGIFVLLFFGGIGVMSGEADAMRILGCVGFSVCLFLTVVALPGILAGWGILQRAPWARVLGFVVAILYLFAIPIGTLVGIYALWVLSDPEAKRVFEGLDEAAPVTVDD